MDETGLLLIFDAGLFLILIGMLAHHMSKSSKERKKTEQIKQELETEKQKTNKFHVSIEEIRKLTKG